MRSSWLCVDVSQKVMVRFANNAMNCSPFGRMMHERLLISEAGHSETFEPEDASNSSIFVGCEKEVVVEPEQTGVVPRGHCYFDVDEQATVVAVAIT